VISHLRGSVTTAPRNSTYMFGATRTPAEDGHRAHGVTQAHGQPWWTWQESNLRLPGASRVLSQLSYKPALRVSGRAITPTGMSRTPTRVSLTGRAGLLQEFPFPASGLSSRIRTGDPLLPEQTLYRAELCLDASWLLQSPPAHWGGVILCFTCVLCKAQPALPAGLDYRRWCLRRDSNPRSSD
jgi:hypothetical protein